MGSDVRGFTLIELLVVVSLLVVLAALGLFVSFSTYRESDFHDERQVVLGTLWKARSQALAGTCTEDTCTHGRSHGVYFASAGIYVIYEGDSYETRFAPADEVIHAEDASVLVSGCSEVVFTARSAEAHCTAGSAVDVTDGSGRTAHIEIAPRGRISWND